MNIQFASDLHLEFPENSSFIKENPLMPVGDILILAGDIVPFSIIDRCDDFFSYISDNFRKTFWIPGNHEYYYSDIADKSGSFVENIKNNVFLLNNTSIIEEDVKLIFSTLWSNISDTHRWTIENSMNDFRVIKNKGNRFSSLRYNELHQEAMLFLSNELKQKSTKTVVVTHHTPTLLNYPEKYKGSTLNEAFAVELFDFIEENQPDYWLYGHTHSNTPDFEIGNTKLRTNQLGYVEYNEHRDFMNTKNIII